MSVTITGLLVAGISWLLNKVGVTFVSADLTNFVLTAFTIVGAVMAYVGRVRQGDITWYGAKKS